MHGISFDLYVVSLEYTHQVQSCDALLTVSTNRFFNILKGAPSRKSLVFIIYFSVLVVDLNFMEAGVPNTFSMNDEATLGMWIIVALIFLIVVVKVYAH